MYQCSCNHPAYISVNLVAVFNDTNVMRDVVIWDASFEQIFQDYTFAVTVGESNLAPGQVYAPQVEFLDPTHRVRVDVRVAPNLLRRLLVLPGQNVTVTQVLSQGQMVEG